MNDVKLPEILFDVRTENTTALLGGLPTNSENSNVVIATYEDGTEKALNFCSDRYNVVSNEEIFVKIEQDLTEKGYIYEANYSQNNDGTTFAGSYDLKKFQGRDLHITIGKSKTKNADIVFPQISVTRSFNGSLLYAMSLGYFRMICSNGMVIPYEGKEASAFYIKGKHTAKLSESLKLLTNKLDNFASANGLTEIAKRYKVLTDKSIPNMPKRLKAVLEATKIKTSKKQLEAIENVIRKEKATFGTKVNDWLIYNGINWHIHNGVDAKGQKRKSLINAKQKEDSAVINWMLAN